MTPFAQLRLWWRRGAAGEKIAASVAAVAVLALAAWVVVPVSDDDEGTTQLQTSTAAGETEDGVAAGDATQAPAGATDDGGQAPAAGGTTGGQATGGAPTGGTGAAATGTGDAAAGPSAEEPAGEGSSCLPTAGQGVTDKTILVAVPLLDLAGPIGNGAAGVASAEELERIAAAVIDDINARGGVQCRKLTAKYYRMNPISPDGGRSGCLQILQDKPAIVTDVGGFAFPQGAYLCVPQQRVPVITSQLLLPSELAKYSPYIATPGADMVTMVRNSAFGLRDRGFFDPAKGFKKLGLLMDECSSEANKLLEEALAKAGVGGDKISKYTFACPPNGFGSPTDMAAGASQHRREGVSHVIPFTGSGSFNRYVDAAEGQLFRPKYAVTDYQGVPVTAASNLKPNPEAFHGALAMTGNQYGMETTANFPVDAGTRRCQAILKKAGFGPEYSFGKQGGLACTVLWDAEAAFARAASFAPDAILKGLLAAGTVQHAYPSPDATFKAPNKFYGGDTWTPIQWAKDCSCWHRLEPTRRPSYPPA